MPVENCPKTGKPHRFKWVSRDRSQDAITLRKENRSLTTTAGSWNVGRKLAYLAIAAFASEQGAVYAGRQLGPIVHANVCQDCDGRDR